MRALRAGLLAFLICGGCGGELGGRPHPDVVLIVVDTLRADRLACYGYPRPTSPELDRLAREGTLFEDNTAQFAWTVPSMVSMLSGRYVTDWREILTDDMPCLAESFQRAGYATLASVANQLLDAKSGFTRGFDSYDLRPSKMLSQKSDPENSRDLAELFEDLAPLLAEVLGAGPSRPPVFLYLHAYEPHDPYWSRKRFEPELPLDGALPSWPSPWHREQFDAGARSFEDHFEALASYRGKYDHELRYFDEQLTAVLVRLGELGLLEHAVVAVASDHGEGLWDHRSPEPEEPPARPRSPGEFFYGQHGALLHQEAVATPLILWGAGVPAGARIAAAVENIDLFPTLLELAGLPLPPDLDGRSLVPLARGRGPGPEAGAWRELVFAYGSNGRAMVRRTDTNVKLVLVDERPFALYDLAADPGERVNLLGESGDLAAELQAAFVEWRARHGTGSVAEDLIRTDAEALERLRRLGYTEGDVGH